MEEHRGDKYERGIARDWSVESVTRRLLWWPWCCSTDSFVSVSLPPPSPLFFPLTSPASHPSASPSPPHPFLIQSLSSVILSLSPPPTPILLFLTHPVSISSYPIATPLSLEIKTTLINILHAVVFSIKWIGHSVSPHNRQHFILSQILDLFAKNALWNHGKSIKCQAFVLICSHIPLV